MKQKTVFLAAILLILTAIFAGCGGGSKSINGLSYFVDQEAKEVTITKCKSKNSTEVVIPAEVEGFPVTGIGANAFKYCNKLTNVTIPDSVTTIGDWAFLECSALTSVTIPKNVTFLGDAFAKCDSLKTVNWNATDCISKGTFFPDCLTTVNIGKDVKTIPAYAFADCKGLTSITIPEGVTNIGDSAFKGCVNLKSVTIPSSITSIGYDAFQLSDDFPYHNSNNGLYLGNKTNPDVVLVRVNDESCKSFAISQKTKIIGSGAFQNCKNLTNIVIPGSVTCIGASAFYSCSSLTSIAIPEGVTTIGSSAFVFCDKLTNVSLPNSLTTLGGGAFSSMLLQYNEYDNARYLGNETNPYVVLVGVKDKSVTSCTISEQTKIIGNNAFKDYSGLTSITIPSSVTSIGNFAFSGSGLTSIAIPDSVKCIGEGAFKNCGGLSSAELSNNVAVIEKETFFGCGSLKSITISDSVKSIELSAFSDCSGLTDITIPKGMMKFGTWVFKNCNGLTNITFKGAKAQWNAFGKIDYWDKDTGDYTVQCTDGNIKK